MLSKINGKSKKLTEECDGKYFNASLNVQYEKSKENKIKRKTVLQNIFRCRNQKNSQYYFTTGAAGEPKTWRDVISEPTPFSFPEVVKEGPFITFTKAQSKVVHNDERNKPYNEQDNYKTRQHKDLRTRLYLPQPPDNVKTIVEIDPEFYSVIEGRPIMYPFGKETYSNIIRQCYLYRLQTGYQDDEILQIEQNFLDEQRLFKDVCLQYNEYVESFESFLSEDYDKSMSMLKESEEMSSRLQIKNEEFKKVSAELGAVRKKVYVLEEKCRLAKMYQEFLHCVAPLSWYKENVAAREESDDKLEISLHAEGMFEKYRVEPFGTSISSLENLMKMYKVDDDYEPRLYFTKPLQMAQMMRGIVMQNLTSWVNAEKLTEDVEKIKEKVKFAEERMDQEYKEMEEIIFDLRVEIEMKEKRAEDLKDKVVRIIKTCFYEVVASDYALTLHVYVQDVYENLIFRDICFTTYEMMRIIEREYEMNMLKLEEMNIDSVQAAQKEIYAQDLKTMKTANEAAKKLKNLDKLNRRLKKVLAPQFKKTEKPAMFSTLVKKDVRKISKRNLPLESE